MPFVTYRNCAKCGSPLELEKAEWDFEGENIFELIVPCPRCTAQHSVQSDLPKADSCTECFGYRGFHSDYCSHNPANRCSCLPANLSPSGEFELCEVCRLEEENEDDNAAEQSVQRKGLTCPECDSRIMDNGYCTMGHWCGKPRR